MPTINSIPRQAHGSPPLSSRPLPRPGTCQPMATIWLGLSRLVQHARELYELLLEQLNLADPYAAEYSRGMSEALRNRLRELEAALADDPPPGKLALNHLTDSFLMQSMSSTPLRSIPLRLAELPVGIFRKVEMPSRGAPWAVASRPALPSQRAPPPDARRTCFANTSR